MEQADAPLRLILVTGGQRSGKSEVAEQLAMELSDCPLYVATAEVRDAEMAKRVKAHRARRDSRWLTDESPLRLADIDWHGRNVALVDCVTMWATNVFFHCGEDTVRALQFMTAQLTDLAAKAHGKTMIFVTNEVGLGGISADPMQRAFTDLQGSINAVIAAKAKKVIFTVSGIPVTIKDEIRQ